MLKFRLLFYLSVILLLSCDQDSDTLSYVTEDGIYIIFGPEHHELPRSLWEDYNWNLDSRLFLENSKCKVEFGSDIRVLHFSSEEFQLCALDSIVEGPNNINMLWTFTRSDTTSIDPLKWSKLEMISFRDNQRTVIPKSIVQLPNLKKLNFSNNSLVVIPDYLRNLKSLRELYLYGNQIKSIDTSDSLWDFLEFVDLTNNSLDSSLIKELALLHPNLKVYSEFGSY